jgi:hypothetical protein
MEILRANQEELLKEQERQENDKKQKQKQMKDYFEDTINGKGMPVAQIGSSEIQFLSNRAVATPDLKKKQKLEAKRRMEQHMELINSKQKMKQEERQTDEQEALAEKKKMEEDLRRQQEEEAAKKAKVQADMADALKSQMAENQKKKQQEQDILKNSSPYLPIGEHYIEEHEEHCKDCGRVIQTIKTFHKPPNKTK